MLFRSVSQSRYEDSNLVFNLYYGELIVNVEKGRSITVDVLNTDAPEDVLRSAKISDSVSGEILGDLSEAPFTFTLEAGNSFWIAATYEDYEAVISLTYEGMTGGEDKYSYPSVVPAAVSSQLDQGGEERIHVVNNQSVSLSEAVLVGPTITGAAPSTRNGEPYTYIYSVAIGSSPDFKVSIDGELPAGLTMNVLGEISGTPAVEGLLPGTSMAFPIKVRVTDGNDLFAELSDSIVVTEADIMCGAAARYAGGQSFPSVTYVVLGSETGLVNLRFATAGNPDKFEFFYHFLEIPGCSGVIFLNSCVRQNKF